jgi:hypothetical protein
MWKIISPTRPQSRFPGSCILIQGWIVAFGVCRLTRFFATSDRLSGEPVSSHEASTDPSRGNIVLLNVVFGLVMFANAYLLFQVQPLISKAILPWFGGTPAVWNTCLLFFQITLFGGYLYAHLLSTKLLLKTQLVGHGLLLLLACIVLPIRPNPEWKPDGTGSPIFEIVLILAASVGLRSFHDGPTAATLV